MNTEKFRQRMKLANMERLGEMQPNVMGYVEGLDERFVVEKFVLHAEENTIDLYLEIEREQGMVVIYECDPEKGMRGWAEIFIRRIEDEIDDPLAETCIRMQKEKEACKVMLRGSNIISGMSFHSVRSSFELENIVGSLICAKERAMQEAYPPQRPPIEAEPAIAPNCTADPAVRH